MCLTVDDGRAEIIAAELPARYASSMRRTVVAAGFLSLAPIFTRLLSCSDPAEQQPSDAGVVARDGAKDARGQDAAVDAGPCEQVGYLPDDAYAPSCGFCYASAREYLPAPIAWKACPPNSEPQGMVCRQMVEDWDPGNFAPLMISPFVAAWVQPNDSVTFVVSRLESSRIHRLVADADGPVHQAVLETTNTCTLGQYAIQAGKVAYRVYDSEAQGKPTSYGGGSMGGAIDDLRPRVYAHYHDKEARSYYASAIGLLEVSTSNFEIKQYDWTTGAYLRTLDSPTQNGNLPISQVWPVGDAVFSDAYGGLTYLKLRVWTLDGGARDFVSFGSDWTKGAGGLASDGVSLVWSQGDGRPTPNSVFDQARVMGTGFTTTPPDGGKVIGTTSPIGAFTNPGVVGCGYLARQGAIPLDAGTSDPQGILLFRLSDGRQWELPNVVGTALRWGQPLALTCTELFAVALVGSPPVATLARVRLDSIGPGQ